MYEKFKNELIVQLNLANLSHDDIRIVSQCLDIVAYNYDVKEKETQLVPYNNELPSAVKQFLVTKSIKGLSEKTLYNYKKHLELFFFQIKKDPTQVKRNDIEVYLYWYKKTRNISDRSLDKVLDCLKSFFNWMYQYEYIERDPTSSIEPIKYSKKPQTVLTEMELEIVRRSCITPKEKALVEFFFSTGCRVAEVVNMKISDVNFSDKTVSIFGKGKKYRIGFLNIRAELAILDYLHSRTDNNEYLFVSDREPHQQMSVAGIEKIIRTISSRANIGKNITCHVFRRTLATVLLDKGAEIQDIQKILGHENINVTLQYAKVSMSHVQDIYKRFIA